MTPTEIDDVRRSLVDLFPYVQDKWTLRKWDLFYADMARVTLSVEQAQRVVEQYARENDFVKFPLLMAKFASCQRSEHAAKPMAEKEPTWFEKQRALAKVPHEATPAYAAAMVVARWVEICGEMFGHLPDHFWPEARQCLIADGGMRPVDADAWMVQKLGEHPRTPPEHPTPAQVYGLGWLGRYRQNRKAMVVRRAEKAEAERSKAPPPDDLEAELDARFGKPKPVQQASGRYGGWVGAMNGDQ